MHREWLARPENGRHRRRIGVAVAGVVLSVLVAMVALVIHQRNVDVAERNAVENSYLLRTQLQRVFSSLQDVETSVRGFVITGQDEFLIPYDRAREQLPRELATLRLTVAQGGDLADLDRLDALTARKLQISRKIILLRRGLLRGDPEELAEARQGKAVMDEVRAVLGAWEARERARLANRIASASSATHAMSLALGGLSLGVVAMLVVAGFTMAELVRSREQADAASRAKSAFLTMMSHELRTPLNGVLGMAHALDSTALDARQRSYVGVIDSSGRNLLAILNDILDLSKIEAGRLETESIPFALTELVAGLGALWSEPAKEKGLALSVEVDGDVPDWARGDPMRLRQVLTNLLSNALKFTEEGAVALQVGRPAPDRLEFQVSDTGVGISPAVMATLFEDFKQADASTSRRFGGTGLGLSISRRLCRLMGGDLLVQSVEGAGTTFTGWVKIEDAAAQPSAVDDAGPAETPVLKILAVDDNASNRAVIQALLEAMGQEVVLACDGAEAIHALKSAPFDLVLMDVNMPVMNGVAAVAAIRAGKAGDPLVPIIALTADTMTGDRERYLACGFDDHLGKPIQPSALAAALGSVDVGRRFAA